MKIIRKIAAFMFNERFIVTPAHLLIFGWWLGGSWLTYILGIPIKVYMASYVLITVIMLALMFVRVEDRRDNEKETK